MSFEVVKFRINLDSKSKGKSKSSNRLNCNSKISKKKPKHCINKKIVKRPNNEVNTFLTGWKSTSDKSEKHIIGEPRRLNAFLAFRSWWSGSRMQGAGAGAVSVVAGREWRGEDWVFWGRVAAEWKAVGGGRFFEWFVSRYLVVEEEGRYDEVV